MTGADPNPAQPGQTGRAVLRIIARQAGMGAGHEF